ncbi:hypothetical protein [Paenibacillus sp. Marseille-Q4541]|uniref:hypothetical protein n=1 Tax=Paenibacillus sp. Marseille-Q4541 TaxID=2831522 RepID=UPI001BA4D738|nr:hypothetical protein [Paenibacillus sp. Marseille-Q4541]
MIKDKKVALTAARQAGAAKAYALYKANRQFKREKILKDPYVPGTIGLSEVSTAIKKEYGVISDRWTRKMVAEATGRQMKFYGGSQ